MKNIVLGLVFFLNATVALAQSSCPDFTGTYMYPQVGDQRNGFMLIQNGCDTIVIDDAHEWVPNHQWWDDGICTPYQELKKTLVNGTLHVRSGLVGSAEISLIANPLTGESTLLFCSNEGPCETVAKEDSMAPIVLRPLCPTPN